MIQPATATSDSLIGDLLSLDLPSAAPPTQYGYQSTGQYTLLSRLYLLNTVVMVTNFLRLDNVWDAVMMIMIVDIIT